MLFLTFLVNVLMMVYKNQNLLRASIMRAGNSHRLGANEAPPAIPVSYTHLDVYKRQVVNLVQRIVIRLFQFFVACTGY